MWQERVGTRLSPDQEAAFQRDTGWGQNREREFYDQRAAWLAGELPGPGQHGQSRFKFPGHARQFVGGQNTITGGPPPTMPLVRLLRLLADVPDPKPILQVLSALYRPER